MQRKKKMMFLLPWIGGILLISSILVNLFIQNNKIMYAQEPEIFKISKDKSNLFLDEESKIAVTFFELNEGQKLFLEYSDSYSFDEEKTKNMNLNVISEIKDDKTKHQITFELSSSKTPINIFGSFNQKGEQSLNFRMSNQVVEEKFLIKDAPTTIINSAETSNSSEVSDGKNTDESTTEVAITKKAEQTTTDSIKTIGETKDSVKEQDMSQLTKMPAVPTDFDWNLLNTDGLDLSSFTEVNQNTPVKLTGGIFNRQQRDYYMFFGRTTQANTYDFTTKKFKAGGNMLSPLGRTKMLPLLGPAMIGIKKDKYTSEKNQRLFGYEFSQNGESIIGSTNSGFDVGELTNDGSQVSKSIRWEWGNSAKTLPIVRQYIIKQYIKDNEIVSYGFVARENLATGGVVDYQPIRVRGYIVDFKKGRIAFEVNYFNASPTYKLYAMTYGIHVDIGGAHKESKLFSNGDDGLYFNQPIAPVDQIPARLFFWQNTNNGPTSLNVGDLDGTSGKSGLPFAWQNMHVHAWQNKIIGWKQPYQEWLKPGTKGSEYQLTHPIFAYRWPLTPVAPMSVGVGKLEISIEEPSDVKPIAQKEYTNLTSSDGKNHIGDTVEYELTALNDGEKENWEDVSIQDEIPKDLEIDTSSMKLVTVSGYELPLPTSAYNKETRLLSTGPYGLVPKKQVSVKFKAKIVGNGSVDIINKMMATNPNNQEAESEVKLHVEAAPQEPGSLQFVSAPSKLDFGESIKISQNKKEYPLLKQDGEPLIVQDTRKGDGNHWRMTATLLKDLTSTSGHKLFNGLHYRTPKEDYAFATTNSIPIEEHLTVDNKPVNISNDWENTKRGPVLVVLAGSAYPESYSASIRWTVEDVPQNR
ncbi:hypothetical protein BH746_11790 [Enterococcus faecalis]|uniref:isopeptide-forming domain-containing fimbrial protein n=1 Tax=Enterococcus faecalis TaxID=1351 RepID=UPI0009C0FFD4|nr:isopeptide-forming domain-containing fimbrial protein [Enterococcus faecalis]OQO72576.1 hypothetical protein BH746_11790 [Enterococcus faecalis]